jgi:hypothetical protein
MGPLAAWPGGPSHAEIAALHAADERRAAEQAAAEAEARREAEYVAVSLLLAAHGRRTR